MTILKPEDRLPEQAAITIGNFDGLHRGHQAIIAELRAAAKRQGCDCGLVTFEPSPQLLIHQEFPFILTPWQEKQQRLAALGLDFVYVIPFNEQVRQLTAEAFLVEMILARLRPRVIVIGSDHRFGADRKGDARLIAGYQQAHEFELVTAPEFELEGAAVKSTRIRERLVLGAVRDAAELLGYRYSVCGPVVRGRRMGARLGFPTVNIEPEAKEKLIPAPGVYAVLIQQVEGISAPVWGAMNIGFRPTFGPGIQSLEVHILDFHEELYDQVLTVEFVERLRPERKFASIEDLKNQIASDVALARIILTEALSRR